MNFGPSASNSLSREPSPNSTARTRVASSALVQAGLGLGLVSFPPSPIFPPEFEQDQPSASAGPMERGDSAGEPTGVGTSKNSSLNNSQPRKSGPRVLLRRAKSFSPSSDSTPVVSPSPSPLLPPGFNTSPPTPNSIPINSPLTPSSSASSTSPDTSISSSPVKKKRIEPPPAQAHWLFQQPTPGPLSLSLPSILPKRRESEDKVRVSEVGVLEEPKVGGNSSGASRRSTFSLFRRNGAATSLQPEASTSSASLSLPSARNRSTSLDEAIPYTESQPCLEPDSQTKSPPPTLPSLQLSPHRLSWAFGSSTSPTSSTGSPTVVSAAQTSTRRQSLTPTRQRSYTSVGPHSLSRPSSPFRTDNLRSSASIPNSSNLASNSLPLPPVIVNEASPKRPSTVTSETSVSSLPSTSGSKSYFANITSLFTSSSSNSNSNSPLPSYSRNSSSSSLLRLSPTEGTSEFGQLFEKGGGEKRRRGLSVGGNGLFGGASEEGNRKRTGSNASLGVSPVKTGQRWSVASNGSGNLQVPGLDLVDNGIQVLARGRAHTDPKRGVQEGDLTETIRSGSITGSISPRHGFPSPPTSPNLNRRSSFGLPPLGGAGSGTESPRGQNRSRATSEVSTLSKVQKEEGETPETFVQRLVERGKSSEIARRLSISSDAFYTDALAHYLTTFDFTSAPLDIALRLFLMQASLPTETQQIDRVMEAFAIRYQTCNPGLWDSSDTPYVLAFSLVMLSTDQFNKSNKNKMKKEDYVKNAKIDGVANEVLEYFFDQITLTPFVFVEDDDAQPGSLGRPELSTSSSFFSKSTSSQKEKTKLDPYHMIAMGLTGGLRIDVDAIIPSKSPFSFTGTTSFFNATTLHLAFARAPVLQINNSGSRSKSASISSPAPPPLYGAPLEPATSISTYAPPVRGSSISTPHTISSLKIAKIGVLSRKEDLTEGGRKSASRKWKGWSVVLTASQLLFFKDPLVVSSLQQSLDLAVAEQAEKEDSNGVVVFTIQSSFKPDAVLSLASSAAVYDSTYAKHQHVFRLIAPAGRQYLFQAHDSGDLNAWLAHINYAASFKTANLRIRGLPPKRVSAQHGIGLGLPQPQSPSTWSGPVLGSLASSHGTLSPSKVLAKSAGEAAVPEGDKESTLWRVSEESTALPAELVEALQVGAYEEQRTPMPKRTNVNVLQLGDDYFPSDVSPKTSKPSSSPGSDHQSFDRGPVTRAEVLRIRIAALEEEISLAKTHLHNDLRLARNLAVLTPFRASTRERIVLAIRPVEERVRHSRMTLAKLVCHREVLARDLLADDRESQQRTRKLSHGRHSSLSRHGSLTRPTSPLRTPRASNQGFRPSTSNGGSPRGIPLSPSNSGGDLRNSLGSSQMLADDEGEEEEEDMTDFAAGGRGSLTDDELDRLKSPPLMQRSLTSDASLSGSGRLRAASNATFSEDELPIPLRSSSIASISTASFSSHPPRTSPSTGSFPPSGSDFGASEDNLAAPDQVSLPDSVEELEPWRRTRAAKRVSLIDWGTLDQGGVSSLLRIREERRSEMGSAVGGSEG